MHCAVRNELVCSPRIAALLFSRVAAVGSKRLVDRDNDALTRREHEIVSLIMQGLSNKEISRQLRIQNATVKNHIYNILSKLQVRRRGEVAARIRGGALLSQRRLIGAGIRRSRHSLAAGLPAETGSEDLVHRFRSSKSYQAAWSSL